MGRLLSSVWAGALAMFVAKAMGVPLWRDWDIGDQADFFMAGAATVWFALGHLTPTPSGSAQHVGAGDGVGK